TRQGVSIFKARNDALADIQAKYNINLSTQRSGRSIEERLTWTVTDADGNRWNRGMVFGYQLDLNETQMTLKITQKIYWDATGQQLPAPGVTLDMLAYPDKATGYKVQEAILMTEVYAPTLLPGNVGMALMVVVPPVVALIEGGNWQEELVKGAAFAGLFHGE